jgi:hypothetical protein
MIVYAIGTRLELHPATDDWMRGDRFGTVERVGRKYLYVRMDRSGRLRKTAPRNVYAWSPDVPAREIAADRAAEKVTP